MQLDSFLLAAGLLKIDSESSPALVEAITDSAEQFLRAGGVLSLSEWSALSEISRAGFAEAGDRIRAEQVVEISVGVASRIAASVGNAAGAAAVQSEIDGGQSMEEMLLDAAVDKAMADTGVVR